MTDFQLINKDVKDVTQKMSLRKKDNVNCAYTLTEN